MELWALGLIVGLIVAATSAFIWLGLSLRLRQSANDYITDTPDRAVDQIFTPEFADELRNKARQDFAELLKIHASQMHEQLVQATGELNGHVDHKLQQLIHQEFAKYQDVIANAHSSVASLSSNSQQEIDNHQQTLKLSIERDLEAQKKQRIEHFEENMADIINNYVLTAIGQQADGKDAAEQIINELESRKQQIVEDMSHG